MKKIFIHFFKLKIVLLNINVNHIMECFIYIVIHFYTKSIKFQFYSNNFCRDTPDTFLNLREKINRYAITLMCCLKKIWLKESFAH